MIPLHRLTHPEQPIYVNPDLIQQVEATPDTVIALTTHAKLVVTETPEEVMSLICGWRAAIMSRALGIEDPELGSLAQIVPFSRGDR
jgi:flagellar protein FlbD